MGRSRALVVVVATAGLLLGAAAPTGVAAAEAPVPEVVAIRAAHHGSFDRLVFEFRNGLPARRSVRYVDQVRYPATGRVAPVSGRARLAVEFSPARADDGAGHPSAGRRATFALPNILEVEPTSVSPAGWGVGLAKRTPVRVFTLRNPDRVVLDIEARFRTVPVRIAVVDSVATGEWRAPVLRSVVRRVVPPAVAAGALDRIYAGVTAAEQAAGLRVATNLTTGWSDLSIRKGVARVRLLGECDVDTDYGIAEEVMITLRQFPTVRDVKLYDAAGTTQNPNGPGDSVPWCLRG